jgi:hypothetical protein
LRFYSIAMQLSKSSPVARVSTSRLTVRNFTRVRPLCQGLVWIFGRPALSPQPAVSGVSLRQWTFRPLSYSPLARIVASFAEFLPLQDPRPSREVSIGLPGFAPSLRLLGGRPSSLMSVPTPCPPSALRPVSAFRFLREPRLGGGEDRASRP